MHNIQQNYSLVQKWDRERDQPDFLLQKLSTNQPFLKQLLIGKNKNSARLIVTFILIPKYRP